MGRASRNPDTGLTDKEEAFCQYLIGNIDASDSDAYRHAYNCSRMKPATVNSNASRLKNSTQIAARLNTLRAERCERTKIDADYVIHRIREVDEMDVIDIMEDDGSIKPLREWPKVWRTMISGIELTEVFAGVKGEREVIGFLKKLKWPDKQKNLEMMGKHVSVQAWKESVSMSADMIVTEVTRTIVDPKAR